MHELRQTLQAQLPSILVEWQGLTQEEPWLSLPAEHRLDSLPEVLSRILDTALGDRVHPPEYRATLEAAAKHGAERRAQGFGHELLFSEYYLLREALRRYLTRQASAGDDPRDGAAAIDVLLRVDLAVSQAQRASLLGYHRPELDAAGRWPEVLDSLAHEARFVH